MSRSSPALDRQRLEAGILSRGRELFRHIGKESPSIFNKAHWVGKVLDWCMGNERFKVQLFRFIDVLPYLTTRDSLARHLDEYFGQEESVPAAFRWGLKGAGLMGKLGVGIAGAAVRKNLEMMARGFIVGSTPPETVKRLGELRKQGFAFTVDALGEATISEKEAEENAQRYLELLSALEDAQRAWPALGLPSASLDWGDAPKVNISVKPSALYSQADPLDFDGSVAGILDRLTPICRKVARLGGFLCIDIEMRKLKNITFEVYRRLRSAPEFRDYPHLGLAVQTYLREADGDVDELLAWATRSRLPISIRLVKGAYWDYETVIAQQNGWPIPVYTHKAQTDAAFERNAEKILRAHDICHLACASHNVRSVTAVMEMASVLRVPAGRFEFQALYGMAEPFRRALLKMTDRVRLYCPHGELLPGMAYLIRRLLENTSNESFLRQAFVEEVEVDRLLARPESPPEEKDDGRAASEELPPFANEPVPDWTRREAREAYASALADARKQLGKTYPLFIDGRRIIEKAGRTPAGQASVKRVIAEMGGKNAIIIDDDADLDEAVPAVISSAFGYQGQKCSACSRAIVLDAVYDRFIARLVEAARSLKIGPAEDPANHVGPVIDGAAQSRILEYVALARHEGNIVYSSDAPSGGFYVPLAIVTGITPAHRLAQEEVFGPVLAVMRAKDFSQAIEWANSTRFALTGGVFSRSPEHLERCRREFRVGNLYINRGITGAIVGRQPFGGFRMSGVGSKAGGPDYLLQFLDPRAVTENTMRRGFVADQGS
ncbi:MAG: aldehyde dehydrogenase family protein [Planctomycetes bacterium]|nr:aldehyde dehydrogenase family protein [Planctomycetota bacterium]